MRWMRLWWVQAIDEVAASGRSASRKSVLVKEDGDDLYVGAIAAQCVGRPLVADDPAIGVEQPPGDVRQHEIAGNAMLDDPTRLDRLGAKVLIEVAHDMVDVGGYRFVPDDDRPLIVAERHGV